MLLLQPHHRITIFIITMLLVSAFLPVDGKPNNGDYEHNRANYNNLPSSAGDEFRRWRSSSSSNRTPQATLPHLSETLIMKP